MTAARGGAGGAVRTCAEVWAVLGVSRAVAVLGRRGVGELVGLSGPIHQKRSVNDYHGVGPRLHCPPGKGGGSLVIGVLGGRSKQGAGSQ